MEPPSSSPYANRNVRATLVFSFLYSLGCTLWAGDAQAAYIYLQTGYYSTRIFVCNSPPLKN